MIMRIDIVEPLTPQTRDDLLDALRPLMLAGWVIELSYCDAHEPAALRVVLAASAPVKAVSGAR